MMPREARQEWDGMTGHIRSRGVDRMEFFLDDEDRRTFLAQARRIFRESDLVCLAWALMPNHYHFVARRSAVTFGGAFQRLNLLYAQYFNCKYARTGHLYENRFRLRGLEHEGEVLFVIRYVHLNPIESKLVRDIDALEAYPWTGHAGIVESVVEPLVDVDEVLTELAPDPGVARRALREYMEDGLAAIRHERGDSLRDLVGEIGRRTGVHPARLIGGGKEPEVVEARALVAHVAVRRFGYTKCAVARALGVAASTITYLIPRGDALVANDGPWAHLRIGARP